jgi:hypothetical protein
VLTRQCPEVHDEFVNGRIVGSGGDRRQVDLALSSTT